MEIIGFAGTAKNTGKTTALNCLHHLLLEDRQRVLLTSIGLDGEGFDQLTFLSKPEISVYPGDLVATSSQCLENSDLKYEIIRELPIETPLGKIFLLRIIRSGQLMLAGPSHLAALQGLIESLSDLTLDVVLIDGSLNRLFPLSICQNLILATGAARSRDVDFLIEEINALDQFIRMFQPVSLSKDISSIPLESGLYQSGKRVLRLSEKHPLLDMEQVESLVRFLKIIPRNSLLVWNKLIALDSFSYLIDNLPEHIRFDMILVHPFYLMITENAWNHLQRMKTRRDISWYSKERTNLLALIINPFYPDAHFNTFRAKFIDSKRLLSEFRNRTNLPVFDLKRKNKFKELMIEEHILGSCRS